MELIAVSKLQPASAIREAHQAGQRHFGENYAQELRDKASELADLEGLCWHAIGPLQLNKVKYVVRAAAAFHALDRLEVARELSRRRQGPPLSCLIELNLGGESSKGGIAAAQLPAFIEAVRALPNLEVVGLMTLPPLGEDPRPYFRAIATEAKRWSLPQLSIGTTADFESAIEEGATAVRVGTALFGERVRSP